ncbi:MAG: SDR family NAD(P)-dependent oxidoreductase [Promethearchaeota archaeon]
MHRYEDTPILVTGGAGFIGSELVRQLHELGAIVTVLDNFSSGADANLAELQRVYVVRGDIRDQELVKELVKDQELIFNLAAFPFIPASYAYPRMTFEVNVTGTLNVLLAAMTEAADIKMICHVSTSEVYGTAQYIPMNETHPLNPHSTYAVSKLAADRLCFTLHHEHDLPIAIIRPFNAYGPRETHPYIIPILISQLSRSNSLNLGNIESSRDFTYVADTVRGLLLAGQTPAAKGETINLGSNSDIKIKELCYLIARLMRKTDLKLNTDPKRLRPLDVNRLCCSNEKAQEILKWTPEISLEEGLQRTITWFENNGRKWPWEKRVGQYNLPL